jgi:hypothetical protein
MPIRLLTIFLPFVVSFIWSEQPEWAIAWTLLSSVFIAAVAQTKWFRQVDDEDASVTQRLLRPESMYHIIFIAYNVIGGGAYALDTAGYTLWASGPISGGGNLVLIARCQQLMLLGHASVTAGMKLAGFRYGKPRYLIPSIPPYSLMIVSFLSLGAATVFSAFPSLAQLSQKLVIISMTSISVETAFCIWYRRYNNLLIVLCLLGLNIFQQSVSGWKGNILWMVITLGALLYPYMPKRVMVGGGAFILFWALYFYPFAQSLRPLIWNEGMERNEAVRISLNESLEMPLEERLDNVWEMVVGRANELFQFGKYLEFVPENHPYYDLEIVSNATTAVIPRVIWPDKPDLEVVSMQRVYEAGITSHQSVVSAKSNFYQDGYLSWGVGGVFLGSLVFGAMAILAGRACEHLFGGYGIGTCLIYTSLFSTIVTQPPNLEYLFAAVAMSTFLTFALFVLGRATGWIVLASKVSPQPEGQARRLGPQKVSIGI